MSVTPAKKRVASTFGKGIDVVMNPDHPFLLFGPDLLAAKDNILVGVFLPHVSEFNFPEDLLARMALSRLVFSDNFQAALAVTTDFPAKRFESFLPVMKKSFDHVYEWNKRRELSRLFQVTNTARSRFSPSRASRETAFMQAAVLYAESTGTSFDFGMSPNVPINQYATLATDQTPQQTGYWPFLSERRGRRILERMEHHQGFLLTQAKMNRPSSVHPNLARIGRRFFQIDNTFSDGAAIRRRPPRNIALVDRIPEYRSDPEKWIRAASFAGFSLLLQSETDRIDEKLARIDQRLARTQ